MYILKYSRDVTHRINPIARLTHAIQHSRPLKTGQRGSLGCTLFFFLFRKKRSSEATEMINWYRQDKKLANFASIFAK